jgi:hypothetical protein
LFGEALAFSFPCFCAEGGGTGCGSCNLLGWLEELGGGFKILKV